MFVLIHVMFGDPLKMQVSVALEDACWEMLLGGFCITIVRTVQRKEPILPVQLLNK